jgi:hypothetical protein
MGAVVAWLTVRDSHASVVLAAAFTLVAALVGKEVHRRRVARRAGDAPAARPAWTRPSAVLACGLLVAGGVATVAASHGKRHVYPLRNVFQARVLPYSDRVDWFAAHGMPQADRFAGPEALAPYREEGQAPVVFVGNDDRKLRPWLEWVERDGRARSQSGWRPTPPTC